MPRPASVRTRATRTKWDTKREASYDALVRSAMHTFYTKGYAAATVADIVGGTGYTSGAFYQHFASKDDCFWHVVAYREKLRGDWAALAPAFKPATISLEDVLKGVFAHFASAQDGLNEWVLVMIDFYQQHRADVEAMSKLGAIYQQWRDNITRFIQALQANGWIDGGRDPRLLAEQIFAYTEGLTVHTALYRRAENSAAAQHALVSGIVKLLRDGA